jgi:hypothetical protein
MRCVNSTSTYEASDLEKRSEGTKIGVGKENRCKVFYPRTGY